MEVDEQQTDKMWDTYILLTLFMTSCKSCVCMCNLQIIPVSQGLRLIKCSVMQNFLFSCVMSKSTDMLNLNTAGTLPVSTEAPVICCSDLLFAKVQPIKRTNYRKGRWKEMTCVAAPKPSIK